MLTVGFMEDMIKISCNVYIYMYLYIYIYVYPFIVYSWLINYMEDPNLDCLTDGILEVNKWPIFSQQMDQYL